MIATKFVICLLASVVVTMGFKLDEESTHREADETFEMSAGDAGDGTNEQTEDGSLSREADSEEDSAVESENNTESNNSTLSRQASYPSECGHGRDASSHFAKKFVTEAFDLYSSTNARRDAIWRSLEDAKKNPHVVTIGDCLPADWHFGADCVYYKGEYVNIYY